MDLWLTSLSCIFDSLFGDTPFGHIFLHMPIWPNMGHMGFKLYGQKQKRRNNLFNISSPLSDSWEDPLQEL